MAGNDSFSWGDLASGGLAIFGRAAEVAINEHQLDRNADREAEIRREEVQATVQALSAAAQHTPVNNDGSPEPEDAGKTMADQLLKYAPAIAAVAAVAGVLVAVSR